MEQLEELLIEELKDLYSAEKQIVKALPKLVKGAASAELKQTLNAHLEVTKDQVARLEQVFGQAGQKPKAKACKGMEGLLAEGAEQLQDADAGLLRDLAIIGACQRVEHYEVAAYGTVRTIAEKLAMGEAVQLLSRTLSEEEDADKKLTQVAEALYGQVMSESQEDDEHEELKDSAVAMDAAKSVPAKQATSRRR